MVEIVYNEEYSDERFERDRAEILEAYRMAMKSGGRGFSLRFADGDYEIQGEADIHRFIDMYKERKRELVYKKKCEAIDKQYSH
jgi:hypothetical protein